MPGLFRRWRRGRRRAGTFFRRVLGPLFFGALNTRPERRAASARRLGALPYLNGGLFERTVVERRFPGIDLRDATLAGVFDHLLDRYRFTTRESADERVEGTSAVGVDPEMLGRVFEGLMAGDQRGETGTFFTPAAAVDRLVGSTLAAHIAPQAGLSLVAAEQLVAGDDAQLDAPRRERLRSLLSRLRVLDPACGSGAFLLGVLSRLGGLRSALEGGDSASIRRDIVAQALHGVDVQADAALLCALRLWLALSVPQAWGSARAIEPLPNLDRRIRQGDALLDPLDLAAAGAGSEAETRAGADASVRHAAAALAPLAARYTRAEPGEREALQRSLLVGERTLARAWVGAVELRYEQRRRELERQAAQRDLWGGAGEDALEASKALLRLQADRAQLTRMTAAIEESNALPFFSFGVHFAEATLAGFDLVITNPPWVRAHRWPASLGRMVRRRYLVCREPGWRYGAELAHAPAAAGAQVDLSLLFLERTLGLLAEGGTLGMLLPAKVLRSLYGGAARRLLLQRTRLAEVEDHSLHQHSIFAADAFATSIVATREATAAWTARPPVRVALHRRRGPALRFHLEQAELPLFPGDDSSPWLLVPPAVRSALRDMQQAGPPLGKALRVRRGAFTGANDVLVVREASPRIGYHAWIRAEGWFHRRGAAAGDADSPVSRFEGLLEEHVLRPLLRGSDVSAWRYRIARHVIWLHGEDGRAAAAPPRARAYLERHRARLESRNGARPGMVCGALFRVTRETLGPKVVWHDLARTLKAVALPASARSPLGSPRPIIPLNTVYFIATEDEARSLLLAALLNSGPLRTFARAIAERAKDARFRFFASTIGALPLPAGWCTGPLTQRLQELARAAHESGGMTDAEQAELDAMVASLYHLSAAGQQALAEFDAWLSGA
jgi:hypothetical protein